VSPPFASFFRISLSASIRAFEETRAPIYAHISTRLQPQTAATSAVSAHTGRHHARARCALLLITCVAGARGLHVCPPGSYAASSSSCNLCPARHWKSGADARAACLACPPGSGEGLAGGQAEAECACDPGWHGPDGGPCVRCAPGAYKPAQGSAPCVPAAAALCPPGFHRAPETNDCLPCPAETWKAGTTNATVCSDARPSPRAHARSLSALADPVAVPCSDCSSGTFSDPAALVCSECLAGTYSAEPAAASNASCLSCGPGTYAPLARANAACALCPPDTFSAATQAHANTTCSPCSATQVAAAGARECVTCPPGTYKRAGAAVCAPCEVAHFCAGGVATRCHADAQTAPPGRTNASAPQDCRCNAGFAHRARDDYHTGEAVADNACYACAPGHYSAVAGALQCSPCGRGFFSVEHAAAAASACAACANDTFSPGGERECARCPAHAQAPAGSGGASDCRCNAGYAGADGGPCAPCPPGSAKPGPGPADCAACRPGEYAAPGARACAQCPANASSAPGSTERAACKCDPGLSGPDGADCAPCPAGSFKPGAGAAPCQLCPPSTYSAAPGSAACEACPGAATSLEGASSAAACATAVRPAPAPVGRATLPPAAGRAPGELPVLPADPADARPGNATGAPDAAATVLGVAPAVLFGSVGAAAAVVVGGVLFASGALSGGGAAAAAAQLPQVALAGIPAPPPAVAGGGAHCINMPRLPVHPPYVYTAPTGGHPQHGHFAWRDPHAGAGFDMWPAPGEDTRARHLGFLHAYHADAEAALRASRGGY